MTPLAPRVPTVLIGSLAPLGADGIVSGIAKQPAPGPWRITAHGIDGDAQGDRKHHGGPEKALHQYSRDHYAAWQAEIGPHPLLSRPGAFGENLSTLGWFETNVCIGDVVRFGPVLLQISQGRQPCFRLNRRFGREGMAVQVQRTGRTGWYYRVLESGVVEAGTALSIVDRPQPDWPLARLLHVLYRDTRNREALARAADIAELAEGWRALFRRRLETDAIEDWHRRLNG
jgi:MOSC domain-containing protein YiiM